MKKRAEVVGEVSHIICILCPKGCHVEVGMDGTKIEVSGKLCKKGIPYVEEEFRNPKRILTTTIKTEDSLSILLPVRTSGPIPKKDLMEAMVILARMKVRPPIRIGEAILQNIFESGQDIIASDDLLN